MKPNSDDEIREFSYGAFLIEMGNHVLFSGRESFQHKNLVTILQAVFGYEDSRTWKRKIDMCLAKGYIEQKNKTTYRLTDLGYQRMRMAKGVPVEANTQAAVADEPTGSEVYETSEPDIPADVDSYLQALQRGGRQA